MKAAGSVLGTDPAVAHQHLLTCADLCWPLTTPAIDAAAVVLMKLLNKLSGSWLSKSEALMRQTSDLFLHHWKTVKWIWGADFVFRAYMVHVKCFLSLDLCGRFDELWNMFNDEMCAGKSLINHMCKQIKQRSLFDDSGTFLMSLAAIHVCVAGKDLEQHHHE